MWFVSGRMVKKEKEKKLQKMFNHWLHHRKMIIVLWSHIIIQLRTRWRLTTATTNESKTESQKLFRKTNADLIKLKSFLLLVFSYLFWCFRSTLLWKSFGAFTFVCSFFVRINLYVCLWKTENNFDFAS